MGQNKYQGRRLANAQGKHLDHAEAAPEKESVRKLVPEEPVAQTPEAPKPERQAEDTPPAQPAPASETGAKEEKKAKENRKRGFWADYGYLIVTAVVVVLVFRVLLQLSYVPSSSMESIIPTDSLLISWQMPYLVSDPQPQRGDVVTFWNEETGKLLVKRVIGLPGEKISFSDDGYVYVDDVLLEESYLDQQGVTKSSTKTFLVPEGCLFVLGDNRIVSKDSRYLTDPYVKISDVRARVLVCVPVKYHPIGSWKGIPLPVLRDVHSVG